MESEPSAQQRFPLKHHLRRDVSECQHKEVSFSEGAIVALNNGTPFVATQARQVTHDTPQKL